MTTTISISFAPASIQTIGTDTFETIVLDAHLDSVRGGAGDIGKCFDDMWPWAVSGIPTGGAGAALNGAAAGATSVHCGDGNNSPATLARTGLASAVSHAATASASKLAGVAHDFTHSLSNTVNTFRNFRIG